MLHFSSWKTFLCSSWFCAVQAAILCNNNISNIHFTLSFKLQKLGSIILNRFLICNHRELQYII